MAKSRLTRKVVDEDKARVIRLQASLVRDEGFFLAAESGSPCALVTGFPLIWTGSRRIVSTPAPSSNDWSLSRRVPRRFSGTGGTPCGRTTGPSRPVSSPMRRSPPALCANVSEVAYGALLEHRSPKS
jgi:hypothetical protein